MSNIFDALHRRFFEQLFYAELTRPDIQPGTSFGGAKPVDVMNVVERVLFGQNAGHVLLRVKRPPFDEAGHVEIEVLEVGPPSEEQLRAAEKE